MSLVTSHFRVHPFGVAQNPVLHSFDFLWQRLDKIIKAIDRLGEDFHLGAKLCPLISPSILEGRGEKAIRVAEKRIPEMLPVSFLPGQQPSSLPS